MTKKLLILLLCLGFVFACSDDDPEPTLALSM